MTSFLLAFPPDSPDGLKIPLDTPQLLVGRDSRCNFRPNVDLISKLHCAFLVSGSDVLLRDLSSTNGTYVNGQRLRDAVTLRDGDKIRIASLVVEFRHAAAPVAPTPPLAAPAAEETVNAALGVNTADTVVFAPKRKPDAAGAFDPLAYLFDDDGDMDSDQPATIAEVDLAKPAGVSDTATDLAGLTETKSEPAPAPAPPAAKAKAVFGDTQAAAAAAISKYMSPRRRNDKK